MPTAQELWESGHMSPRRRLVSKILSGILHWSIIAALLSLPVAWLLLVLKVTLWPQ
jgi:hypothetical protein